MDIIDDIRTRAGASKKHVVLPESSDWRVLKAAFFLVNQGICEVTLLGQAKSINRTALEKKLTLPANIATLDVADNHNNKELAEHLYSRRKHKGLSKQEAYNLLNDPLYLAAVMVATGSADACVAGSLATTGQVIRAAINTIGLQQGCSIVSGMFLMAMPDGRVFTYGDCGVVPYPDASQLADIAIECSRNHKLLTKEEPITAMLSFSTKGSAKHQQTELVTDALRIAKTRAPDLNIDGELQFDAAFVPEIAQHKAPNSQVAGRANVFVFPNLDAGNIAYKITERLAGATATGPILQGLARPMMDLSRGCNWQDIVNAACVAILMGEEQQG